jgi:DNA modification methylase
MGSGTTCVMAARLGRRFLGMDVSARYVGIARGRLDAELDAEADIAAPPGAPGSSPV